MIWGRWYFPSLEDWGSVAGGAGTSQWLPERRRKDQEVRTGWPQMNLGVWCQELEEKLTLKLSVYAFSGWTKTWGNLWQFAGVLGMALDETVLCTVRVWTFSDEIAKCKLKLLMFLWWLPSVGWERLSGLANSLLIRVTRQETHGQVWWSHVKVCCYNSEEPIGFLMSLFKVGMGSNSLTVHFQNHCPGMLVWLVNGWILVAIHFVYIASSWMYF